MFEFYASRRVQRGKVSKLLVIGGLFVVFVLVLAACQPAPAPAEAPPAEPTVAAPAEEPAEEPTEEPTEEPAEEAEATAEPTEEPAEEAEATAEPTEEPGEEAAEGESSVLSGAAERGAYVLTMTRGCGCHMNRDLGGPAGGNPFEGPFGKVFSRNISQDVETGIGGWSDEEIANALRLGQRPDGTQLHPIMPYRAWSALSDQDVMDLVAFLRTWDAIPNEVPARELTTEPAPFEPATPPPAEAPTEPVARGQYIATLARCGDCHTPRNDDGSFDTARLLAGAPVQDTYAANLTPDEATGLGAVADEDIAHFLMTGEFEDGSMVDGPMAQVVTNVTSKLTEEDVNAIVAFLRSIPAVENSP
jgi:mono/diheme cytochrome c family protein